MNLFVCFCLDVFAELAEKEAEARNKILEERLLREEARKASLSNKTDS